MKLPDLIRILPAFLFLLGLLGAQPSEPAAAPVPAGAAEPVAERWEAAMAAFAAADQANPPVPGGVVFVGSSSIRLWKTLAGDFPGLPAVNRGFGGSQIADSVRYFDVLIRPHRPRLVVMYAGTNDVAGGKEPEQVAADFREFCGLLHAAFPEARIIYISCVLAPARWDKRALMALTNAYMAAYCAADPRREFVDVNPAMLTAEGETRPELFVADRLHMSPAGYEIWKRVVGERVWGAVRGEQ